MATAACAVLARYVAWSSSGCGGHDNEAAKNYTVVAGGTRNKAKAHYSSVFGGWDERLYYEYMTAFGPE